MYPKNAASPPPIGVGQIYLAADGTLVTSGASVRVQTGTGAWAAGGGTLACDSTSGTWVYTPTQAETNAASFIVSVYKSACTAATITVATTASDTPGYGGIDWGLVRQASSTVSLSGTTIKTATDIATQATDIQGRLPAVLVGGRMDATVGAYQSGLTPLQPTVAGRTLDVSAGGEAGIDWGNIGTPGATVTLSATTISTAQQVASVTGAVGSVAAAVSVTNLTVEAATTLKAGSHYAQTGDAYGLIGVAGAGLTALAPAATALSSAVWTTTKAGYLDAAISSRLAGIDYTAPLSSSATAGAVWDSLLTAHTVTGSFGLRLLRTDSSSAGNGAKVTPNGHVASVLHDAEPDSIPEDAFISGALSARVLAADCITAAKVASDVADEIAATVDAVLTAAHGAGSWAVAGSGSGAYVLTITVTDGTNPLQNAVVRVAEGITNLTATTNSSGVATFSVDAATYAVSITKSGYSFTPTTLAVSGAASQAYTMTAVVIPSPPSPSTSTVVVTCYDELTAIEPGAKLYVKQTGIPAGSTDIAYDGTEKEHTANALGVVQLTLWRNATYQIRRGTSKQASTFTPTTATYSISSVIGTP